MIQKLSKKFLTGKENIKRLWNEYLEIHKTYFPFDGEVECSKI